MITASGQEVQHASAGLASDSLATIAQLTALGAGLLPIAGHAGLSVPANATTGTGPLADVAAGTDTVLGRIGSGSLAFGKLALSQMSNFPATRLMGNDTGTGAPIALTVTGGVEFTGSGGIQRSALAGDVTAPAGSNTTTIASHAVSSAKFRQSAGLSLVGVSGSSTADVGDIIGTADQFVRVRSGTLGFGSILASDVSGLTLGSVAFAGSSGLTQDNAHLFYDATGAQLRIGTNDATAATFSNAALRIGTGVNYFDIGRDTTTGSLTFHGTQSGFDGYLFGGASGTKMSIASAGGVSINGLSAGGILAASPTTGLLGIAANAAALAAVSGTNTGDQTIALTGDVTGSGTGSFATTLATTVRALTITSTNIGIDQTTPLQAISLGSGSRQNIDKTGGTLGFGTSDAHPISIYSNGSTVLTITSSGICQFGGGGGVQMQDPLFLGTTGAGSFTLNASLPFENMFQVAPSSTADRANIVVGGVIGLNNGDAATYMVITGQGAAVAANATIGNLYTLEIVGGAYAAAAGSAHLSGSLATLHLIPPTTAGGWAGGTPGTGMCLIADGGTVFNGLLQGTAGIACSGGDLHALGNLVVDNTATITGNASFGDIAIVRSGADMVIEETAAGDLILIGGSSHNLTLRNGSNNVIQIRSGAVLSLFGAAGHAQYTFGGATAGGTYGATEQQMLQRLWDMQRGFGGNT